MNAKHRDGFRIGLGIALLIWIPLFSFIVSTAMSQETPPEQRLLITLTSTRVSCDLEELVESTHAILDKPAAADVRKRVQAALVECDKVVAVWRENLARSLQQPSQ